MKKAMSYAKEFFHRADIFLLVMGLICAIFGIVVISSATASYHSAKYGIVQSASLILGVFAFVVMTVLDVDVLVVLWLFLCVFFVVFLLKKNVVLLFVVDSDFCIGFFYEFRILSGL